MSKQAKAARQVWVKPNGAEIRLNDSPATVAKAKSLGWRAKGAPEADKKPEGEK